jgi:hypothetical protein
MQNKDVHTENPYGLFKFSQYNVMRTHLIF